MQAQARICPICIDDHSESVECRHADLVTRIKELDGLVYVPGHFRCSKCNFYLVKNILYAQSGTVGPNDTPAKCDNGCGGWMARVTWKERVKDLGGSLENLARLIYGDIK